MTDSSGDFEPRRTKHGFLAANRRVFSSYHAPTSPSRRVGYVICPPLGYEGVHCHHSVRLLAEELAGAGFPTLRVHYDGTGESMGSDSDPGRLSAWTGSIRDAVRELAGVRGVEAVGLVGIRMGAALASLVSTEVELASLVLWEPCASGALYTRELEILASATHKSAPQEGAMPTDAEEDGVLGLTAAGYLLTQQTLDDLRKISLYEARPAGTPDLLLVSRDDRPVDSRLVEHLGSVGCAFTVERLAGHKEMMAGSNPITSEVPMAILAGVRDWAIERAPGTAVDAPDSVDSPDLAPEVIADGLRHRVVRFGPLGRLFGVLTAATGGGDPTRPTVIVLTGGVVPRTAVNRMWVTLGNELATLGHAVLRMDVSGIGESPSVDGVAPNQSFPPSLLPDVRSAIDFVLEDGPGENVWLIGLCSGASAAFRTGLSEERVAGVFMINPPVFYWDEGGASDSLAVKQFSEARHYRQSLFRASSWVKLFSGGVDVRHILAVVATRAKTMVSSRLGKMTFFGLRNPEGLVPDLHRMLNRSVDTNFAFSPGDPNHEAFQSLVGRSLNRLQRNGLVVEIFHGADHTFSPMGVRRRLFNWVIETITRAEGAP